MPSRLKQLIQNLSSRDEATRRFAVEDLGDLRVAEGIPPLVALLNDASAAIREPVVDALSSIGQEEGEAVVQAMLPALRSESSPLRNAACEVLRNVGEASVSHLGFLLSDDDKDVRKFAVDVLALIASPAAGDTLTKALDDVNINVAAAAAESLGQIKCGGAVDALKASLQANSWVRCSVARSLGQIGGAEALQALNNLVGDEDDMVMFTAVQALGDAGDMSSVQCLLYLLNHANPMIINTAFAAIERILERTSSDEWRSLRGQIPLKPVIALLSHPNTDMRRSAVKLLGKVGDEAVIPTLVDTLVAAENRDDETLRELALQAIVSIAPEDIAPVARVLLDDTTSVEGRCELVDVLGQVGRPDGFTPVAQLLDHSEVILRRAASRALAGLDTERAGVLLCKALSDTDGHVRANAARGLGQAMAHDAVYQITACLKDPLPVVREAAAWAVGTIGGVETTDIVSALKPLLRDEYPDVREAASEAMVSIASSEAIDAMEELAEEGNEDLRLLAVKVLGRVDPSPSVERVVRNALSDPSPVVCAQAIEAFEHRGECDISEAFLAGLEHDSAKVRSATLKFLAKQQPGEWTTQLCSLFKNDSDEQVRHDCATALGYLNPPGTVDLLIEFLTDEPQAPYVVLAAIGALARIGDPRAEEVLGDLAGSDDSEICEAASSAIEEVMEQAAVGV